MFEHIEPFAGDPILSLNEDFQKDPRPHKINLSIGIYFDDEGRIPVLDCVHQAEARMLERGGAKPYLPIEGNADFRLPLRHLAVDGGNGHIELVGGRPHGTQPGRLIQVTHVEVLHGLHHTRFAYSRYK